MPHILVPQELVDESLLDAKAMDDRRIRWLDQWQLVGEYGHTRKQNFTVSIEPGEFLNRELFDASMSKAIKTCASTLLAMLWPASRRRIKITPPEDIVKYASVKKHYERMTRKLLEVLDNPLGGLPTALQEYMIDQVSFGTSGIEDMDDPETDVSFRPWGVKNMSVMEDDRDRVDKIHFHRSYTVRQLRKIYKDEDLSEQTREKIKSNKLNELIKVRVVLEPRPAGARTPAGVMALPIRVLHIEEDAKWGIKESGMPHLPSVCRFTKIIEEEYGRSLAMDALPSSIEVNVAREATDMAIESSLEPPLGVYSDAVVGNGEIDTSPRGVTVVNSTGRAGDKQPIFPLFTVGSPEWAFKLIELLQQDIADHLLIDKLLDFNNKAGMTLGEANMRDKRTNNAVSAVFIRQIAELFTPLISKVVSRLIAQKKMGVHPNSPEAKMPGAWVIPKEVLELMEKGVNVYSIEYFTPALKIMHAEELEGIRMTWEMGGLMQTLSPDVGDNLNGDEGIRRFSYVAGAPSETLEATNDVEDHRKLRATQKQKEAEMQMAMAGAETARNLGQSGLVPTQKPAEQ